MVYDTIIIVGLP